MSKDVASLLDRVCEMAAQRVAPQRLATAKRRCADILAGRESDYLPMAFSEPVAEVEDLPSFDWKEQFHDPAKSLYTQIKDVVLPQMASGGDNVPHVRADTGVVNCMTVFGADYTVPEHTKPVVCGFPSKEALAEFEVPDDISALGTMPRVREHMEHHLAVLRRFDLVEAAGLCHCDQQGPFDIAAQTRGHDIFVDFYDDSDFVHNLMDKCAKVYVAVTRFCKQINGELSNGGNAVGLWMEKGGVRMCGDSDILVGAELHREFIQPYEQRALKEVGPGWFHYCGGQKGYSRHEGLHLHENYAATEGLRGLNWTTAGDWLGEMRRLKELEVAYVGTLRREEEEGLEDYLRRALSVYDRRWGLIFLNPQLRPGEHGTAMETWHRLQDELF